MGKLLIYTGLVLIAAGVLIQFTDRLHFFGKLPGDIAVEKENFRFYFPVSSSIVISIVLSLIFWLVSFLRK